MDAPRESQADDQDAPDHLDGSDGDAPEPRFAGPEASIEHTPSGPVFPLVTLEYTSTQLVARPLQIDGQERLSYGLPHHMALDKYTYEGKAIATLRGNHFYIVHFGSKTGPYNIERRELFGFQKGRSYSLKSRRPTALFARGPWLYVGGIEGKQTRVDTIDFSLNIPQYKARFTAKQSFRQEIDDFAITGNTLIAIDDVVIPKYAYVFSIGQDGSYGKHELTSYLPIAIGGTYPEGVADGNWLYLRGTFDNGHGLGGGQMLLRISIAKTELKEQARLTEYDNGTDPKIELLYGQSYTKFQGIEVLGDVLLVGAGERGLFALPKQFQGKEKATYVDVGGACTDIIKVGGQVFALVQQSSQTKLAWLIWDPASKKVKLKRSYNLKGRPSRFPR